MLTSSENYLFIPSGGSNPSGTLYELGEKSGYIENAVVLLPYQNPQVKKAEGLFFPILKRVEVLEQDFPENKTATGHIILKARTTKSDYIKKVLQLKEHIQKGNIYEITYCIEFFAEEVIIDPLLVFKKLHELAKAPYSAILKTGDDFIICGSPELFLKKEGNTVSTKPIKGTAKRGLTAVEDESLKNTLYNSLKERTENVMAVDVARNDLSHFAKRGTVEVNKLYNIESFETVHQMVSTVSCLAKENTGFESMMEAAFPMASMTGAPKLRAMQLIDEVEDFERKNYSGAFGVIDTNGDFSLSVIIRSIFYNQRNKTLSLAVGGAITYLSDPEKEYEECLLKANALLKALDASIV